MRLPNIQQDQSPLKTEYFEVIATKKDKKYPGSKIVFDWKNAEAILASLIKDDYPILENLIEFQNICIESDVPQFYSYFFIQNILFTPNQQSKSKIDQEIQLIKTQKSNYHIISSLIRIRDTLLLQLAELTSKRNLQTYEKLDDLRFVSTEIVKSFAKWKNGLKNQEVDEPIIFVHEGNNYLVKMVGDNVSIINSLNVWKQNLIFPPNPFFVNEDGSYQGMTQKQKEEIDECMEILANEKAEELKCIIHHPKYISKYTQKVEEQELTILRGQLQTEKNVAIAELYTTERKGVNSTKKRNMEYYESRYHQKAGSMQKIKSNSPNSLQKMIKNSEIAVLKQMKSSKVKSQAKNSFLVYRSKQKEKSEKGYQTKIDSLRKKIEQTMKKHNNKPELVEDAKKPAQSARIYQNKNSTKVSQSKITEIREIKPKIKLVAEKETIVEDVVQGILPSKNLEMYQSLQVRKSGSTFFKPIERVEEVTEEKEKKGEENIDIKPITQNLHNRTNSMIFLKKKSMESSFVKEKEKAKVSNLEISGKKPQIPRMNNTLRSQKYSEGIRSQKPGQSFSYSPRKNKSIKTLKTEEVSLETSKISKDNDIQQSLRIVKGRLRQLAIKKVYQNKEKAPKSYRPSLQKSREEVHFIKQQAKKEESRKPQKPERKITLTNFRKSVSKPKIEAKQKSSSVEATVELSKKSSIIADLEAKLQEKQLRIKKISEEMQYNTKSADEDLTSLKKQRQLKKEEFEREREKMKIQNKLLEEQTKQEEQRLMNLKEEEMRLKQTEMKKKYQTELEQVKVEYNRKLKKAQEKQIEDDRKAQESQAKLMRQTRRIQQLKITLEKKQIEQDLWKEITQARNKESNMLNQMVDLEQERKIIEQEIQMQDDNERQMIRDIQLENKRLRQRYQKIREKNDKIEKEKDRLERGIQQMNREAMEKADLFQQLEQSSPIQDESYRPNQVWDDEKEDHNQESKEDLEELKLRVKKEILEEMSRRRKEEEKEEKIYQEERILRVRAIEKQIKQSLKKQEEEYDKAESQQKQTFRTELQWGQEQFEANKQQLPNKEEETNIQRQDLKTEEIVENKLEDNPNQNSGQGQKENEVQKMAKENQMEVNIRQSNKQENQIPEDNILKKEIDQKDEKQESQQKQMIQQPENQEKSEKKNDEHENIGDNEVKVDDKDPERQNEPLQNPKRNESNQPTQQIQNQEKKESPPLIQKETAISKIEQPEETKHKKQEKIVAVKPTSEQVLSKYKNLQQHIKKTKQIYIEDRNIPQYLTSFFKQFDIQVKEMIPYDQKQIQQIMMTRKVDIFDCQSIGWLENDHYLLVGNVSCVEAIARKYGEVQIEVRYIFNKENPYQKQFLAKKIKLFESIGYVYQKKLPQSGKFSIKFIIKIPKEVTIPHFSRPVEHFTIESYLSIENHEHQEPSATYSKLAVNYLLSQTLNNNLTAEEKTQFVSLNDFESKQISKKLQQPAFNGTSGSTSHIDDNKTELTISLNLKYIQFSENSYYVMKALQYTIGEDRIFIAKFGDSLSAVILESDQTDFGMDTYLEAKTTNLQNPTETILCIPVWQSNRSFKLGKNSPKQYLLRDRVEANLNYGSIIDTQIQKQSFVKVDPPFIFSIFETNSTSHLVRLLYGNTVGKQQIVKLKT